MGCPDYVHVTCPKCFTEVEFQSKAGTCSCLHYTSNDVPIAVADDLNGETKDCPKCNTVIKISVHPSLKRVTMQVEIGNGREWD